MDIKERKVNLIEKWGNLDLYECLLSEVLEMQEKEAERLKVVIDLTNRLRHLEFMSCPIQNADEGIPVVQSELFNKKPDSP